MTTLSRALYPSGGVLSAAWLDGSWTLLSGAFVPKQKIRKVQLEALPRPVRAGGQDLDGLTAEGLATLRQRATPLVTAFPWERHRTVIDVGAAEGAVPVRLALAHPHLEGGGFDLPPVGPLFDKHVAAAGLGDRLRFYPGDFFVDDFPGADVLIMGHILHGVDLEQKRTLLAKAHDALPPGGALIVYDALIDDERRENAYGLLLSLNMLIETPGGFDYTGGECLQWLRDAGFQDVYVQHLAGPDSMAVGTK
jgi:SAM-dependent methyltransferase